MPNDMTNIDQSSLPYYIAKYQGRLIAIKRDADYQTTVKLIQKTIAKLRSANAQDVIIATKLSDCDGELVEISEEVWPEVVHGISTVELRLESDIRPKSDPTDSKTKDTAQTIKKKVTATASTNPNQTSQIGAVARVVNQTSPAKTFASSEVTPTSSLNLESTASRQASNPIHKLTGSPGSFSITIRTPSLKLLELGGLHSLNTIGSLKSLIETTYGMPAALQTVIVDRWDKPANEKTLEKSDITDSTTVDLAVAARKSMIYLLPASDATTERVSYSNVDVQISVNRAWEMATTRSSRLGELEDYFQSVSWTVDVSEDGILLDHGSKNELTYLFWDGITQPLQPPISVPPLSLTEPTLLHDRLQYAPLLEPQNSVAVRFSELKSYISGVFRGFGFGRYTPRIINFIPSLKASYDDYLVLRFMPEYECKSITSLSISQPIGSVARVLVLYKCLKAAPAEIWNGVRPNHAQGPSVWKKICDTTSPCDAPSSACLNVFEISWMEVVS
ncbi:hypothetical protein FRC12_007238 [Ceratobasidium sp. 428]|nr:hypothetical protein FRC12_007238 [Ceratobasidium sp. 428]